MDFNALWSRASAAASEVATTAQEQASRAAAAAQEQAELFQGSETFASLERALADIAANTVAVAEQSERNFQAMLADEADKSRARALAESAPRAFGVDEDLEAFLQGLTEETFAAFPLDAADARVSDEVPDASQPSTDATRPDPEAGPTTDVTNDEDENREKETSGSVVAHNPWRSTHARLALSKIPKLRAMRDALVPDTMDDEGFWRAYFALCAPRLAKVEARAAAAVARSRARRATARAAEEQARASAKDDEEDAKRICDSNAIRGTRDADGSSETAVVAVGRAEGAADAAAALAASFRDDGGAEDIDGRNGADVLAPQEREEEDEDIPPGTPAGDLDAYLNDLLGESSDEDDEDDEKKEKDV